MWLTILFDERSHVFYERRSFLDELVDVHFESFVAVIGLLSEIGERRQESSLFTCCVSFEDDLGTETVSNGTVRGRFYASVVEDSLGSVKRCIVEPIHDAFVASATTSEPFRIGECETGFPDLFFDLLLVNHISLDPPT